MSGTQLGCRQKAGMLAAFPNYSMSFEGFVCFVTKQTSQLYPNKNRIMVRRIVADMGVEGDFLRCISRLEGVVSVVGGPIAVGKHAVGLHIGARRHKHMIDTARGEVIGFKRIEGAVFRKADTGGIVRIFQQSRLGEDGIDFVVLVHVEVASEDDRLTLGYLADSCHHQFGGLATCHHAHVVHVEIKIIEDSLRFGSPAVEESMAHLLPCLDSELAPGADTDAGRIPTEGWLVGRFVEPKLALVEELDLVFFVENRLKLAGLFAVVAPDADVAVSVEGLQHVVKLLI